MHLDIHTPKICPKEPLWGKLWGHPVKLINLPSLLFSGADPTLKDEANKQWLFQARRALNCHTEEAVQSGIIQSVRGEVRELIGFMGFQADLTDILDQVEERFGKTPTADKLKWEFYLLAQKRMKKIQQFASHLQQKYRKLQMKFPGHYDRKQLKDQLFFGMHHHLCDSMHFHYKQEEVTFEDLLSATQEAEMDWTESEISVRAKSASVGE